MWLGRQELSQTRVRQKLFCWALVVFVVVEVGFATLRIGIEGADVLALTAEEIAFLFSTSIIPPLPQYMLSAASSAVFILMLCLYVAEKCAASRMLKWLSQTGKLSLSLYVAHVILGMGFLESIGRLDNQSIDFALMSAVVFCLLGGVFSVIWLRFFNTGPLEWVFRKLAG